MLLLFDEDNPPNLIDPSEDITDVGQYSVNTLTRQVNATESPSGLVTADLCVPTSSNSLLRIAGVTVEANQTYTFSLFAKSTGSDRELVLSLRESDLTLIGSNVAITVTNIWQRFYVTNDVGSETDLHALVGGASSWGIGEDLYLWGLQINIGALASYKRTGPIEAGQLFTFADSMANLADAMVHDGNPNLISPSEITEALNTSTGGMAISPNLALDPNSDLTADLLHVTTGNAFFRINALTVEANEDYTFSFFAKGLGSDFEINLSLRETGGITIGATDSITITNSWQRFSIQRNVGSNTTITAVLGTGSSWSVGEDFYTWGFQLNIGVLGSYKRTGAVQIGLGIDESDNMDNLADAVAKSLDVA